MKATPRGERLDLQLATKVNLEFSGRVITAHPGKPLLYVTAAGGAPGKVPGAVGCLPGAGVAWAAIR